MITGLWSNVSHNFMIIKVCFRFRPRTLAQSIAATILSPFEG